MHTDYIGGVGLALYYNWIVFLGVWGFFCFFVLWVVFLLSDLGGAITEPLECPTMEEYARTTSTQGSGGMYKRPHGVGVGEVLEDIYNATENHYEHA